MSILFTYAPIPKSLYVKYHNIMNNSVNVSYSSDRVEVYLARKASSRFQSLPNGSITSSSSDLENDISSNSSYSHLASVISSNSSSADHLENSNSSSAIHLENRNSSVNNSKMVLSEMSEYPMYCPRPYPIELFRRSHHLPASYQEQKLFCSRNSRRAPKQLAASTSKAKFDTEAQKERRMMDRYLNRLANEDTDDGILREWEKRLAKASN